MILHIFSRILLYVSKINVFQTLHQFHAFASTHFPTPMNNPQYDNGCEYHNTPLHDFLAFYGILYHFSRPHTSQQNGKTERCIRTINDILCTFVFQAHMPLSYWAEAIHTATYLLNHCPTKNLSTLYEALYRTTPSYAHLRVLGLLCYSNLSAIASHKLTPLFTPCIFLDYLSDRKGYRCLSNSTCHIIISRHATFNETSFPFSRQQHTLPSVYDFLHDFHYTHHVYCSVHS